MVIAVEIKHSLLRLYLIRMNQPKLLPQEIMKTTNNKQLFSLGQTVATPGALELLETIGRTPSEFISKHQSGDWGDLCEEDRELNNDALKDGNRLFSSYKLNDGQKIWVITEADRSSTCVLLPSEY